MNHKIKNLPALKKILNTARAKNKKIVFTNGCFDLLHRGHIDYLRKAGALGNVLVVGLNSDSSVRKIKAPGRPITPQADRAEVLASLEFVDYIIIFNSETPFEIINKLQLDVLVKGADWKKESVSGAVLVESRGGRVRLIKYLKGYSTTKIFNKILSRGQVDG